MNAITVHTSALDAENDMFDDARTLPAIQLCTLSVAPSSAPRLSITGILASRPVVRTRLSRDGLTASPVLCLELKPVQFGFGDFRIHAEEVYPIGDYKAAEARAAALPKGTRVTVNTDGEDMHMTLPHVASITTAATP